jgi:hypothetical protein
VVDRLRGYGARTWQIGLTAPVLAGAFLRIEAHRTEESESL